MYKMEIIPSTLLGQREEGQVCCYIKNTQSNLCYTEASKKIDIINYLLDNKDACYIRTNFTRSLTSMNLWVVISVNETCLLSSQHAVMFPGIENTAADSYTSELGPTKVTKLRTV